MFVPLGTNFSELLNIQNREIPLAGPSFTNSCPSPFPHFPHRTWNITLFFHGHFHQRLFVVYNQLENVFLLNKRKWWYFICSISLLVFGHAVLVDGLCEGWPRWWVLVLGAAGEQLVITLGTNINPWGINSMRSWLVRIKQQFYIMLLLTNQF